MNTREKAVEAATSIITSMNKEGMSAKEVRTSFTSMVETIVSCLDGSPENNENVKLVPAVPIGKSITDGYIVCLEDGLKFKSMRSYLKSKYNLTPDEYRKRWGLPHTYPVVCPAYSRRRAEIAKSIKLGCKK